MKSSVSENIQTASVALRLVVYTRDFTNQNATQFENTETEKGPGRERRHERGKNKVGSLSTRHSWFTEAKRMWDFEYFPTAHVKRSSWFVTAAAKALVASVLIFHDREWSRLYVAKKHNVLNTKKSFWKWIRTRKGKRSLRLTFLFVFVFKFIRELVFRELSCHT